MASTLKINTLTGVTTAGSINVTAEGNSTTTNLQQGLAKGFLSAIYPGGVGDSFNVSSAADEGTGKNLITLSNNMNSASHAVVSACQHAEITSCDEDHRTTTGYEQTVFARADSLTMADGDHFSAIFGDLA